LDKDNGIVWNWGLKKELEYVLCVCVKIVGMTIMENQGSYDGPLIYYVLLLNLTYEGDLGVKTKCSTCIIMECKWIWVFLQMFIIVID
jgi:hypothetical protein